MTTDTPEDPKKILQRKEAAYEQAINIASCILQSLEKKSLPTMKTLTSLETTLKRIEVMEYM
jgi:hypothetical protein